MNSNKDKDLVKTFLASVTVDKLNLLRETFNLTNKHYTCYKKSSNLPLDKSPNGNFEDLFELAKSLQSNITSAAISNMASCEDIYKNRENEVNEIML